MRCWLEVPSFDWTERARGRETTWKEAEHAVLCIYRAAFIRTRCLQSLAYRSVNWTAAALVMERRVASGRGRDFPLNRRKTPGLGLLCTGNKCRHASLNSIQPGSEWFIYQRRTGRSLDVELKRYLVELTSFPYLFLSNIDINAFFAYPYNIRIFSRSMNSEDTPNLLSRRANPSINQFDRGQRQRV